VGDTTRGELVRYDQFSLKLDMTPASIKGYLGMGFQGNGFVDAKMQTGWEASATLRQMLTDVIGPASRLHPGKPDYYTAGGKSGTANVAVWNGYDDTQIASFVGFAPADDPEILVLVKLDENQDFETGTQAAAPVFAQLADEILQYLSIPPDDPVYVSGGR